MRLKRAQQAATEPAGLSGWAGNAAPASSRAQGETGALEIPPGQPADAVIVDADIVAPDLGQFAVPAQALRRMDGGGIAEMAGRGEHRHFAGHADQTSFVSAHGQSPVRNWNIDFNAGLRAGPAQCPSVF